jgi:hypothetical protein
MVLRGWFWPPGILKALAVYHIRRMYSGTGWHEN